MVGMTSGPTGVTIQVSVNMEWDTTLITPRRALFCAHRARTPCNPSFSKRLFVLTLLGRRNGRLGANQAHHVKEGV